MTEPTQAQIEAAAEAIKKVDEWYGLNDEDYNTFAKAALTAAAQVDFIGYDEMERPRKVSFVDDRNATIERCAQVAESFRYCGPETLAAIAAAIRALKKQESP